LVPASGISETGFKKGRKRLSGGAKGDFTAKPETIQPVSIFFRLRIGALAAA